MRHTAVAGDVLRVDAPDVVPSDDVDGSAGEAGCALTGGGAGVGAKRACAEHAGM